MYSSTSALHNYRYFNQNHSGPKSKTKTLYKILIKDASFVQAASSTSLPGRTGQKCLSDVASDA